ncbi:DUF6020 family protein [Lachnoclostridium sp. An181]|uniref:DUF6020 family protein n=1 Tax=Lachnoclostridium sp. An181 TaxID=1965575 RepID=UPI000B3A154B|nr:DUF6020 family protein [Lachnoclostridium sp. An181]OUP49739.1 hypothetical protein B5F18_06915 [Lachnoclostridium sp. An181]
MNLKKQNIKTGIMFVMSFLSTYAVQGMLKVTYEKYPISNSIFSLLIFCAVYVLLKTVSKWMNGRLMVISIIWGGIFSACMVCGTNLIMSDFTKLNQLETWLKIAFGIPLFSALVAFVLEKLPEINKVTNIPFFEKFVRREWGVKKTFFVSWILIFVSWIPGLIASYPGIYAYDSVYQMGYYTSGNIYLHHPLIHTYLLGFCVETLGGMFGDLKVGLLIYSLFQMLCLSATFAGIMAYMTKRKLSTLMKVCWLLIFMFLPLNAIMSFSATKDILYSAFFALLVILACVIVENETILYKKWFCMAFIAIVLGGMAFRSQGKYVFIFGSVFGFVLLRKHWKRLLLMFTVTMILFGIYSGPVTKLCNGVEFNSLHEMMSVPCVQLSRAMLKNSEELTVGEKQKITEYVPDYGAYKTFEGISDSMKITFNEKKFKENPLDFLKLWVSVGIKAPMSYIDAFARLTIGWWYPDMNYRDPKAYHPYWEYDSTQQIEGQNWTIVERSTPEGFQWLADFYEQLTYENSYQKVPVLALLFSSGFVCWMMFLYIASCIYKRKYKYLFPVSFVFGLWLTVLLGPVVLYRYVYPIAITIPILCCFIMTAPETYYVKEKRMIKNG